MLAFLVGGFICTIGEGAGMIYAKLGLSQDDVKLMIPVTLVVLASVLTALGVAALLMRFGTVIFNLTAIYGCYMRICMPGERDLPERESRFGFINAARRYQEKKQREYAEYRLGKLKEKQGKNKNGNKHKKRG